MSKKKKTRTNALTWGVLLIISAALGWFGAVYAPNFFDMFTLFDFILSVFVFMLSIPLHIVLHELGHLIGGLLSGYQFIMFRLFNTVWIKTDDGISKRKQLVQGLLGQALMVPPEGEEEPPFLLYHSSGFLMNLLTAILFIFLGRALSNPTLSLLLYVSAAVALLLFISNLIPMKPNDGYNILQHYKRPETLVELTNILNLYAGMVKGTSFTDLLQYVDLDTVDSIENPNTVTLYTAQAAAYFEQDEYEKARHIYEKLWNQREQLLAAHQPEVFFNYLFCLLLTDPHHEDVAKIQETVIYKNYQKLKLADRLKISAAEAMYLNNDYNRASELLVEGEPLIALAPTIAEEKLEHHLYAYLRAEIQRLRQNNEHL